ncbi:predicted protein [Arabidopsis lyrata subsp. lyrata]|uniref:Predicted protein n=1 Tax=Arabidopsis lyrata subsp. lyrata TaxID=81972 RepID=D7LTM7_ARALL|nr:predicted protein [Arabidopsis lyrata subsp. lyrata]
MVFCKFEAFDRNRRVIPNRFELNKTGGENRKGKPLLLHLPKVVDGPSPNMVVNFLNG